MIVLLRFHFFLIPESLTGGRGGRLNFVKLHPSDLG